MEFGGEIDTQHGERATEYPSRAEPVLRIAGGKGGIGYHCDCPTPRDRTREFQRDAEAAPTRPRHGPQVAGPEDGELHTAANTDFEIEVPRGRLTQVVHAERAQTLLQLVEAGRNGIGVGRDG